MSENNTLKTFIRDANNNPVGVAVVVKSEQGEFGFGYSLVNTNSADRFNPKIGTKIAVGRANHALSLNWNESKPDLESRQKPILEAYDSLEQRAVRYFK